MSFSLKISRILPWVRNSTLAVNGNSPALKKSHYGYSTHAYPVCIFAATQMVTTTWCAHRDRSSKDTILPECEYDTFTSPGSIRPCLKRDIPELFSQISEDHVSLSCAYVYYILWCRRCRQDIRISVIIATSGRNSSSTASAVHACMCLYILCVIQYIKGNICKHCLHTHWDDLCPHLHILGHIMHTAAVTGGKLESAPYKPYHGSTMPACDRTRTCLFLVRQVR